MCFCPATFLSTGERLKIQQRMKGRQKGSSLCTAWAYICTLYPACAQCLFMPGQQPIPARWFLYYKAFREMKENPGTWVRGCMHHSLEEGFLPDSVPEAEKIMTSIQIHSHRSFIVYILIPCVIFATVIDAKCIGQIFRFHSKPPEVINNYIIY